jgi:hypothetical protein
LCLLHLGNINAKVAVKVAGGLSERFTIGENIMQGTVWGSLTCTCTMDSLAKQMSKAPDKLFHYKGVPIPPLEMVDDIITVTNVENTQRINEEVNTFMEHKRLKLSHKKCHRIHIGKGHNECPQLRVHGEVMQDSNKEKYLGDIIDTNGNIQSTIDNRIKKGNGIISEISSIIEEFPLGKYKLPAAMKLREAMLINGILFNSESWHGVTQKHIKSLESIDEALLRTILKAHSKTPKEFLYLETGALPLGWVLAQRRVMYLKSIMERPDTDMLKKVMVAQKQCPSQGDFVKLVEKNLLDLGITYEEVIQPSLSKDMLKNMI